MLYACDLNWWKHNSGVLLSFAGLKITQDSMAGADPKYIGALHHVHCNHESDKLEVGLLGHVGWGGNSGFQAINLAVQFGAKKLILVGYDMRVDHGLHWHPDHPRGMHNPTARNVDRWRRVTDATAETLHALGITVINASEASALRAFPKMSLTEALATGDEHEQALLQPRSDADGGGTAGHSGQHREQHTEADLQRNGVG